MFEKSQSKYPWDIWIVALKESKIPSCDKTGCTRTHQIIRLPVGSVFTIINGGGPGMVGGRTIWSSPDGKPFFTYVKEWRGEIDLRADGPGMFYNYAWDTIGPEGRTLADTIWVIE
jgi:hypothetical protein